MSNSGIGGLESMFKLFGPMFLGSPKTTQTQQADPEAVSATRGIAAQATANANNAETLTKDVVDNIIRKNAIAFAPVIAAQKTAGMYNTTALKQLAGESQAAATAEASKAVLDYRSQQLGIAQNANAALLNANKSVTSQTAPAISPLITGGLGVGLLGYSAYKNRKDIKEFFDGLGGGSEEAAANLDRSVNIIDAKDAAFGADVATATAEKSAEGLTFALEGAGEATTAVDSALTASDAIASGADAFNVAGDVSDSLTFATDAADTAGDIVDFAGASGEVTNALTGATEAADFATDAFDSVEFFGGAGDIAAGAGDAIGGVADAAGGIIDAASSFGPSPLSVISAGAHLAKGDIIGAVLSFIPGGNLIKSAVSAITGGGSIICTELRKQGKLSRKDHYHSIKHFAKYSKAARDSYYIWSTPVVKHMKKHPEGKLTAFMQKLFYNRSQYIQHGMLKAPVGFISYMAVSSMCVLCGYTIYPVKLLRDNWKYRNYYTTVLGAVNG